MTPKKWIRKDSDESEGLFPCGLSISGVGLS